MSDPILDFDDDAPITESKELGPTFKLGGELFRTLPAVPGGLIGDIVLTFTGDGYRDIQRSLVVLEALLVERVWIEGDDNAELPEEKEGHWEPADDVERWHALITSKQKIVESKTIARVFDGVLKAYTERAARPTQPSDR